LYTTKTKLVSAVPEVVIQWADPENEDNRLSILEVAGVLYLTGSKTGSPSIPCECDITGHWLKRTASVGSSCEAWHER
jgi:hypothetical protein